MKTSFLNYINTLSLSWGKSIFAISLSLFILIFSYLLGNTSFPLPGEIGLFQKFNGWNSFWGVPKGNVPDSLLFINVCYDKELVDYEENGIPVGKFVITDRKKLLHLLTQAKAANNYRYIFLDVVFENEIKTPVDSALFHTIASMDRIVIPVHENLELSDTMLYKKAANADYTIAWEETNFSRYQFLHQSGQSVPLKMYADIKHLEGTGIQKHWGGLWYSDDGRLCHNGITLLMNVRMTGRLMDTEGQVRERNFIYLGADLLDIDSILPVREQIADKILVIGDFKNDVHETYIGPQPGSAICVNAYIALMNGDHLINWWCALLLFCIYTAVGIFYLSGHSVMNRIKRKWLKFIMSFASLTLFFMFIAGIAYFFDVAFNIWVPTIIYSLLDTVIQKYKIYNEKTVTTAEPDTGN
jgi:hypothetical protein